MFPTNVLEKIKTLFLFKLCCLWDNAGKCGRGRQATDRQFNSTQKRCALLATWVRQEYCHSLYVIFMAFPLQHRLD